MKLWPRQTLKSWKSKTSKPHTWIFKQPRSLHIYFPSKNDHANALFKSVSQRKEV